MYIFNSSLPFLVSYTHTDGTERRAFLVAKDTTDGSYILLVSCFPGDYPGNPPMVQKIGVFENPECVINTWRGA